MDINVAAREEAGKSVLAVTGEVDVHTAPELDAALTQVVEAGKYQIVVDLSGVEFLDSTGLGVLVKALKRVREHDGALAVVATTDRISKVFRITGLDSAIGLHESLESALGA